jgi:hypothetical protein
MWTLNSEISKILLNPIVEDANIRDEWVLVG